MKKFATVGAIFALALTIGIGMALSTADAKPPTPATYKCINQDLYLCTLGFVGGVMYETCELVEYGCDLNESWYCKTVLGQEYACHMVDGNEECIWHPYGCP